MPKTDVGNKITVLHTIIVLCLADCSGIASITTAGVYTLPSDGTSHSLSVKDVYCDMDSDGDR